MDTPRTFSRLEAKIDASASGGGLPAGMKLAVRLTAARTVADESYTLSLAGADKPLAGARADYANATHCLTGTWKLDLADADLTPFAFGRVLPAFTATGEGRFDTDATMTQLHASGRLGVTADRLGALRPALDAVGAVTLAAEFDVAHRGGEWRVDRLAGSVAGARPIARVRALQAFVFNARTGELKVADPAQDLFGLSLEGVPLGWTRPFWSDGIAFVGGEIRGQLVAGARDGGLGLRSQGPLELSGLIATRDGRPLLEGIDVSTPVSASYTPQGWQAEASPCAVRRGDVALLTLEFRAGRLAGAGQPVNFAGRLRGSLPALAGGPGGAAPLRGALAGDFTAKLGERSACEARLTVSDLALDAASAPWSRIVAELRADEAGPGRWTVALPLGLEREGRRSDLSLGGTFGFSPAGATFDGQLTGTRLAADDAAVLGALAQLGRGAAGSGAGPGAADGSRGPFWAGLGGRLTLALKQVEGAGLIWTDVRGALQAGPDALRVTGLQASLSTGGDFTAGGTLGYAAGAARPYALQADLAAADFDYGAFARARDPAHPPALEGKFKISGRLGGSARGPAELGDALQGDFQLAGRAGLFRALRADVADAVKQSPALISQALDSVGSLFGLRDDKAADARKALDKQGQVVVSLADQLREIPYDQINLAVKRGADLDIQLADFALIAPEVRLSGSGRITHQAGVPVLDQPLAFDGQLGARGRIGDSLAGLGLLGGQKDDLGYTRMVQPFHLGGTLASIDPGSWRDLLVKSALHKAANGLLDKLLGK